MTIFVYLRICASLCEYFSFWSLIRWFRLPGRSRGRRWATFSYFISQKSLKKCAFRQSVCCPSAHESVTRCNSRWKKICEWERFCFRRLGQSRRAKFCTWRQKQSFFILLLLFFELDTHPVYWFVYLFDFVLRFVYFCDL